MKSSWRSPDGGSSVARNTKIESCGAVFCARWGTGSTPIRSFHTVSEGVFSEVRGDGVLGSCVRPCYPSYLATLRNTAGADHPALDHGRGSAVVRRITTTTRTYSIALVLMAMLAMVALAALGVFASPASAQDQFVCPAGTFEVTTIEQEEDSGTKTFEFGPLVFDLTFDIYSNGIEFSTNPPTQIAFLVFQSESSTIQYQSMMMQETLPSKMSGVAKRSPSTACFS